MSSLTRTPITRTVDEVARALGVSRAHVYRLIRSGEIPKVPHTGRSVRVPSRWLEETIAAVSSAPPSPNPPAGSGALDRTASSFA